VAAAPAGDEHIFCGVCDAQLGSSASSSLILSVVWAEWRRKALAIISFLSMHHHQVLSVQ
jgi:hypothetical protein